MEAVIVGVAADLLGVSGALWIVAGRTFISELSFASHMSDPLSSRVLRWRGHQNMNHVRKRALVSLIAMFSVSSVAWAQVADDSRDKSEKVSDILAALQAEPGKRVADVGAGEGFYSLRIARAVGPTGRVTAVDVSEKYLDKLRARLQQENVTNVDVVVGALDNPHLPENTFDAVLIYNAYHEMTTPEPILKAIFMALKPGGRLVMSEPLHDNVRSSTRAEQVKDHEIGPNFVEQELRAAGFDMIEQRPDFVAFTSPGHKGGFWLMVAWKPVQQ
jgi:predicted methyltransferase